MNSSNFLNWQLYLCYYYLLWAVKCKRKNYCYCGSLTLRRLCLSVFKSIIQVKENISPQLHWQLLFFTHSHTQSHSAHTAHSIIACWITINLRINLDIKGRSGFVWLSISRDLDQMIDCFPWNNTTQNGHPAGCLVHIRLYSASVIISTVKSKSQSAAFVFN